ncbi:MAG: 1-acyl-sn-glycerol-3-phosphate acyltransferase [Bacteroidia bacterium]|nr:1-acyl-sn-glycerol-3-phosphate acyltransferase [Bacteroidia bacterium]
MKERLISDDDVRNFHPVFRGKNGDKYIKWGMKLSGLSNACEVYDKSKHLTGVAFTTDLLDKLELERIVVNGEILQQFKDRPFIIVANHPNGHVDGIALIEAVASRVKNFKVMVNFILGLVDTMDENFIKVSPYKHTDKMKHVSLSGIKECIDHIRSGNSMGFFPAGSVSRLKFRDGRFMIHDRHWQPSVIKLIQKANVPVIPVHINSRNRYLFYATRFINWQLQSLVLCHELYNKKGKKMTLTFGNPIMPEVIKSISDTDELGDFLREKTYALAKKR